MEISSLSNTALNALNSATTKMGEAVGVAMLGNQLDMTQTLGDGLIRAMENSVSPTVGGNFDVSV